MAKDTKNAYTSVQQFIEAQGATCANWRSMCWSFVNHDTKTVIFGEWNKFDRDGDIEHNSPDRAVILSEDWEISRLERQSPAYREAKKHVLLVEKSGYTLHTFPMLFGGLSATGSAIKPRFTSELTEKLLVKEGRDWLAVSLHSGGGNTDLQDSEPESRHILSDIESVETDKTIPDETTRQRLVDARLGQGEFRAALMRQYGGECPVTGIRTNSALIASHIKPWRDCTGDEMHKERLAPANGILLAAHVDKLFDQGYISFTISGKIMLSDQLLPEEYEKFSIQRGMKIAISDGMLSAMQPYLKHHRDNIFKGDKK